MVDDIIFDIGRDLQIVHVDFHDKNLPPMHIFTGPGPEDDLDDLVDYISIYNK